MILFVRVYFVQANRFDFRLTFAKTRNRWRRKMYSSPNNSRHLLRISTIALFVLYVALLNVHTARGQATATILGTVTDPSGAAIGGAMVQAKNTGTGVLQNTISDEQG